jgi:hypothetical protein
MPVWKSPLSLPRFTSEEFKKLKADYVAKHGYTIYFPGFSDIIKLPVYEPLSKTEEIYYKSKMWDKFTPERLSDIRAIKRKKKEKFMAMLASPAPDIANKVGSIMCAADDLNDSLGTLAVIGWIACTAAPRTIGRVLTGPTSFLMIASDLVNLYGHISGLPAMGKTKKRLFEDSTDKNGRLTKMHLSNVDRINKFMPGKAGLIEALQVTNQTAGTGICLGPIAGFVVDCISGHVRNALGAEVKVKARMPDLKYWEALAMKILKSDVAYGLLNPHFTLTEHMSANIAFNLACQVFRPVYEELPFTVIDEDPSTVLIQAPVPTDAITLELFEEERLNPLDFCKWPGIDKEWASYSEIYDGAQKRITESISGVFENNKFAWETFISMSNLHDGLFEISEMFAGEGNVNIEYDIVQYTIQTLLYMGYCMPPYMSTNRKACFLEACHIFEDSGLPSVEKDFLPILFDHCGITLDPDINLTMTGEIRELYYYYAEQADYWNQLMLEYKANL